jgi:hypothetical protein
MNFRSLNNFLEFNSENEIWKRGKQWIALGRLLARGLILLASPKGQHDPWPTHASGAAWTCGRGEDQWHVGDSPDMVSGLGPHRGNGVAWRRWRRWRNGAFSVVSGGQWSAAALTCSYAEVRGRGRWVTTWFEEGRHMESSSLKSGGWVEIRRQRRPSMIELGQDARGEVEEPCVWLLRGRDGT